MRQINISSSPLNNYDSFAPIVQVQIPTIYSKYCNHTGNHSVMNITGSPFSFSWYYNTFISVGCDNFATITNIFPKVFGCKSDCKKDLKVEEGLKCSGLNCCESTNIPSKLQVFDVDFRSVNESNDRGGVRKRCKYAFLVDKGWLEINKPDPSSVHHKDYVPVVLDWAIYNWNNNSGELFHFFNNRGDVSCSFSDEDKGFNRFTCHCTRGYKGNPYLDGGCEGKLQIHTALMKKHISQQIFRFIKFKINHEIDQFQIQQILCA